jgi:hypothetical protein
MNAAFFVEKMKLMIIFKITIKKYFRGENGSH